MTQLEKSQEDSLSRIANTNIAVAPNGRGLYIPYETLTYEECEVAMGVLHDLSGLSEWGIIDLMNAAEDLWGEAASQLIDDTQMSYGHLANLRTCYRRFPTPADRRWALSISHYQATVTERLSVEQREYLLNTAEAEGWSRDFLRQAIRNLLDDKEEESDRFTGIKFAIAVRELYNAAKEAGVDEEILDKTEKYLSIYEQRV